MRKVKGFSYNIDRDRDVIEYIESQPNQSQYIWSLVRNDMNKTNDSQQIEDLVKKYVKKALTNNEVKIDETNTNTSYIRKEEINQLLDII